MNPQDNDNQNSTTPTPNDGFTPPVSASNDSYDTQSFNQPNNDATPEADAAALQAVETLESEDTTPNTPTGSTFTGNNPTTGAPTPYESPAQPQGYAPNPTPMPTPVSSPQPYSDAASGGSDSTSPFASQSFSGASTSEAQSAPIVVPIAASKKKSKKPLIITLAVVVLLALAVAGYFFWQDLQNQPTEVITPPTTEVTEPQSGDLLPGQENTDPEAPAITPAPADQTLPDPDLAQ